MKNGLKNNKNIIIFVVVLSSFVLLGFGTSKIVLRNADAPFIDLTGSIGNSIGNAEEASSTPGAASVDESPNETQVTPTISNDYRVVVAEKTVTVYNVTNGSERMIRAYREGDLSDFERDIINGFLKEKNIVLVDDYAEYQTYIEVVNILDKHFPGNYTPEMVDPI